MTRVSLERIADTLYPKEQPRNSTAYGSVESINADGSYQVKLNASATTTRCAKLCDADVGDRVLVLIQANGHCAAIGRVGGIGSPKVLYNDANGTTGTVTLSQSAAGFDYMRIYFSKNGDSSARSSVDVYNPDGKHVSLILINPYDDSDVQVVGKAVTVSGTSITNYRREAFANTNGGGYWVTTTNQTVSIYRVEAWNVPPAMSGSRGGGGGGGDHTYALSGSGATITLTEDGTTAAGSYTIPEMSAAEASTGTSTAPRVISAKVLNDLIDEKMPAAVQSGSNLAVE